MLYGRQLDRSRAYAIRRKFGHRADCLRVGWHSRIASLAVTSEAVEKQHGILQLSIATIIESVDQECENRGCVSRNTGNAAFHQ